MSNWDRDDIVGLLYEGITALRAEADVDRLIPRRKRLKKEIQTLTAERDRLVAEIARLTTGGISQVVRRRFVQDIKTRLRDHGVYAEGGRQIDERLFFMAFDEIVGMGPPNEGTELTTPDKQA